MCKSKYFREVLGGVSYPLNIGLLRFLELVTDIRSSVVEHPHKRETRGSIPFRSYLMKKRFINTVADELRRMKENARKHSENESLDSDSRNMWSEVEFKLNVARNQLKEVKEILEARGYLE